ncbi:DNA primase [sulfur-oxidizing endosymbiont of Gigantopelta aegis]|uniref:DNA primase n=1 Tax=sulfur-oxidizing endosymbiont of Gigantopelta aegis TaxID=2794934 RepID=UPI0018DBAE27|nr:DNA primase [sulfur-oxidizing endosymbiont of Gigantopelta aegis]
MAGTIPREFIDEVLAYTDIVELIDSRVPLKRAGNNHMACCPFHGEKTPSFSVNQTKQFYHCFGCGESGDAIRFLTEYEHLSFVEAVEELAQMAGLEVPKVAFSQDAPRQAPEQFDLLDQVSNYYQHQLKNHPQSQQVKDYVQQRGLSAEVIKTFGLGFSPPGWDNVLKVIGAGDEKKTQALFDTGMLIQRDEENKAQSSQRSPYYDRFRERLMFPIRDRRGRTIAFGGRILGDGKPKYLNSPETRLFHKGQELYGLFELKQALRKIDHIVVVEGYMDVVSLAQFGVNYSVATLGTATTAEHLQKLFRLCDEVYFCFDGDRAGREAAWRAMNNTLSAMKPGKQARFMFLPDGEDPDTIVRQHGQAGFAAEMDKAMSFSEFFYDNLTQQVDMSSLDGRSRLIDLSKPYLGKIQEGAFQTLMVARLSELAEIEPASLLPLLGIKSHAISGMATAQTKSKYFKPSSAVVPDAPSPVKKALTYLLQYPYLAASVGDPGRFSSLELTNISVFVQLLDLLQNDPQLSTARILANWQNTELHPYLSQLAIEPLLISDEQAIGCEFNEILQLFTRQYQQQRFTQLQRILRQQGLNPQEKSEYMQLLGALKSK